MHSTLKVLQQETGEFMMLKHPKDSGENVALSAASVADQQFVEHQHSFPQYRA